MKPLSVVMVVSVGILASCASEEPETSISTKQLALTQTEGSVSGTPGTACGEPVFANSLALPSDVAEVVGNHLTITDVLVDHPLISPNDDGVHDDSRFVAKAIVEPLANPGLALEWALQIRSTESCEIVAELTGQEDIVFDDGGERVESWDAANHRELVNQAPGFSVACDAWAGPAGDCLVWDTNQFGWPFTGLQGNGKILGVPSALDSTFLGLLGGEIQIDLDSPSKMGTIDFLEGSGAGGALVRVDYADNTHSLHLIYGSNTTVVPQDKAVSSIHAATAGLTGIKSLVFEGAPSAPAETEILALWEAQDDLGELVESGTYIFNFAATLVDATGTELENLSSEAIGLVVDSGPANYQEAALLEACDPNEDPWECLCPEHALGCEDAAYEDLVTFEDPSLAGSQFITTTIDEVTGRYHVVADLQSFNGGGLIPKSTGVWDNESEIRFFISELTGVPPSMDERLFNFDFTQIGVSTPVTEDGFTFNSLNNVLFDLITDENNQITVAGNTVSLSEFLNSTLLASADYQIETPRIGQECTESANFNGNQTISSSLCTIASGVILDDTTELGIYTFQTSAFALKVDDTLAVRREQTCENGCVWRTYQDVGTFSVDSVFYTDDGFEVSQAYTESIVFQGPAITRLIDRGSDFGILSGQCARAVVEAADLRIRMVAADGAVGDDCIVNGLLE